MYASINNTKIYYDIDGKGTTINPQSGEIVHKPVIFIIHGGPGGSHMSFKPHLDPLAEFAQLVYIDQRGCGFSLEDDPEHYTLSQNVEDVEALRKHLGIEKVWILGHSYGGMVAMSYSLQYQENLNGLFLVTTSPSYRFLDKAKKFVAENGNEEQKYYANKLWEGSFQSEEDLQNYYRVMDSLYSVTSKSDKPKVKAKSRRSYKALNKGFGSFLRTFDLTTELHKITVPTLIIAGEHDWITPVSENEEIHRLIPGSTFHVMKDCSHSVFVDDTEGSLQLIKSFLEDVQRSVKMT